MTPRENKEFDDIRKAAYNEALSILKYTLSIIYPNFEKILDLLKTNLEKLNNKMNKDVVMSILFWLKSKEHIGKMVADLIESKDSAKLISELKSLTDNVLGWEVKAFSDYMAKETNFETVAPYKADDFLTISMSFLIEL